MIAQVQQLNAAVTNGKDDDNLMNENERYFEQNVSPVFKNSCNGCHSEPRFGGTAPLTIYNYTFVQTLLLDGPSSTNNRLINKMRNIIPHTGGNQCFLNGLNDIPCKVVVEWRLQELPDSSLGIMGAIENISPSGNVTGWAKDPNTDTPINVIAYANGPFDNADTTLIGTFLANQAGTSGTNTGFFYNFDIPDALKDGNTRHLYIYGITANANNLLPGAPKSFTIYTPTMADETSTLRPFNHNSTPALVVTRSVMNNSTKAFSHPLASMGELPLTIT